MHEDEQIVSQEEEATQSLFAQLLAVWANYRRFILALLIAGALAAFWFSLAEETRRVLLQSLLNNRILVGLLVIFSLLTLSLLWSTGQKLDAWIFLLFNLRGYHPVWLDRFMWGFTQIGNGVFGILLGIFFYFIGYRRLALELILGILSLWLAVELLKALTERSRPFLALEGTRVVGWRERGRSFPSGHTSQTFFMMTLLVQYFQLNALWGSVLIGLAVLVGFTRIYVGAHYPRDVLAGAILGSVWGILSIFMDVYLSTGQF